MAEEKVLKDERSYGLMFGDWASFSVVVLLVAELRLELRFPFLESLMLRASWLRYSIQGPEFKCVLVKHIIQKQEKERDFFLKNPRRIKRNADVHILVSCVLLLLCILLLLC